jgi:hypothetical protein
MLETQGRLQIPEGLQRPSSRFTSPQSSFVIHGWVDCKKAVHVVTRGMHKLSTAPSMVVTRVATTNRESGQAPFCSSG